MVVNTKRSHLKNQWGHFSDKWITGSLPAGRGVVKRPLKALQTLAMPEESNLKVTYSGTWLICWKTLIVLHIPRPEYRFGSSNDKNTPLLPGQIKESALWNSACLLSEAIWQIFLKTEIRFGLLDYYIAIFVIEFC